MALQRRLRVVAFLALAGSRALVDPYAMNARVECTCFGLHCHLLAPAPVLTSRAC